MPENNTCWMGKSANDPEIKCGLPARWYQVFKHHKNSNGVNKAKGAGVRMLLCLKCVKVMDKRGYYCVGL